MKSIFYLGFALIGLVSCDKNEDIKNECETDLVFRYDSLSGKCLDCHDRTGYNSFDLDKIIKTRSAECMKFPDMDLVYVLDTTEIENFHEVGHNIIANYNFKGADLDSTYTYFNEFQDCIFEGTKMSRIELGYVKLYGKIDHYTEAPESCVIEGDSIRCVI